MATLAWALQHKMIQNDKKDFVHTNLPLLPSESIYNQETLTVLLLGNRSSRDLFVTSSSYIPLAMGK